MIIGIHVILALASLGLSSYNYFNPGSLKLRAGYSLAVGTLASGVALIFVNNASIIRTCLTGIVFFGIVSILNELARKKLSFQEDLTGHR